MLTPNAKAGPAEPAPARTPPPPPPPRRRAEVDEARSPSSGESIGDPIHLVEGPGAKAPPEPLRSPAQAVPKKRKPDQEVASPATADVTSEPVRPEPPTAVAAREDLGFSSGSEVASSREASRAQASSGPPGASLGLAAKTKAKPGSGDAPSRKTKVPRLREAASCSNQPPSQSARQRGTLLRTRTFVWVELRHRFRCVLGVHYGFLCHGASTSNYAQSPSCLLQQAFCQAGRRHGSPCGVPTPGQPAPPHSP